MTDEGSAGGDERAREESGGFMSANLAPGTSPSAPRRGPFWLAVMVSVIALVGGGFVALSNYLSDDGPGAVVTSYFAALGRGDAARALSYGQVPPGAHTYLTATVLRDQLAVATLGPADVLSVSENNTTAEVTINYPVRFADGILTVNDVVPLVQRGDTWRLVASAVEAKVGLAQAGQRALFARGAFPDARVALFPGALPISFDTPNLQVDPGPSVVHFSTGDYTGLAVSASPAGVKAARDAVGSALRSCLAGAVSTALCPVPSGTVRAVPGSLRGSIALDRTESKLMVSLTPDATGVLVITGTVSVDGQYESLDYNNTGSVVSRRSIELPVSAECYATSVDVVTWTSQ